MIDHLDRREGPQTVIAGPGGVFLIAFNGSDFEVLQRQRQDWVAVSVHEAREEALNVARARLLN